MKEILSPSRLSNIEQPCPLKQGHPGPGDVDEWPGELQSPHCEVAYPGKGLRRLRESKSSESDLGWARLSGLATYGQQSGPSCG